MLSIENQTKALQELNLETASKPNFQCNVSNSKLRKHHCPKIEPNSSDRLQYLEKILSDKLLENSRFKESNDKLLIEMRLKDKLIEDLSKHLPLDENNKKNKMLLRELKERVEGCQVEIQKLKKHLTGIIKKKQKEKIMSEHFVKARAVKVSHHLKSDKDFVK
ncbi:hypothetical protein TNCV_2079511 [Trichonephila clavipes]|nr:hypothetical protein TNCV_2079511 [Trichonephila clavipes]